MRTEDKEQREGQRHSNGQRTFVTATVTALCCMGCMAFGAYLYSRHSLSQTAQTPLEPTPVMKVVQGPAAPTNFTEAAELTVNGVVHVMVTQQQQRQPQYSNGGDIFDFFFGPGFGRSFGGGYGGGQQQQVEPVQSSGSGVIVSSDGYIVTNNHVIDNAGTIQVVLNDKRSYSATLVGTDPTTDIALLKIDADGLTPLTLGNSDNVRIGEWVLAVGNPFNLTSTVTAGIVSAKGRHVGINTSSMAIESFIQTDAAVNPGNSGGALVNTRGEVIGINTAIASPTGSFSGYSFAVPSNIVKKVTDDLKAYGEVQRALLGVTVREVDQKVVEELGLKKPQGVLVADVSDGSAAKEAGLRANDLILSLDSETVNAVPELQAKVAQHRPGDSVKVRYLRDGKESETVVTLRNVRGTTSIIKGEDGTILGAVLEPLGDKEKERLGLRFGLKVKSRGNGKMKEAGVKEGYIITKANRVPVNSIKDFQQVVNQTSDGLFLAGCYADGTVVYYAVNLND
ncbi:MAG: Do family serine endopeptidase [Bacteroidales bacterium]|nr:Do family serine endopeptidase [Bacteroidales bacterium]